MKTKILLFTILMAFTYSVQAQSLLDLYKSGSVKLIPDEEYGNQNNWNKVFETYHDTLYGKPMGDRKSIKLMPDGSVVVNHAYHNFYSKFSPNGDFEKELYITSYSGKVFKKTQAIEGVINGNTFFTGADNMGNMLCFDFDGNYKKTLKLDYMLRGILPLPNGKIAVVGWVIWKTKFRDFVSVVDYETNEEKVIWEHFTERNPVNKSPKMFNYNYFFKERGGVSMNTMPFSSALSMKARPNLALINNQLALVNPTNSEIRFYDLNGNYISKSTLSMEAHQISVEEQKEIQQKALDEYSKMNPNRFADLSYVDEAESQKAHQYFVDAIKKDLENIKDPIQKPFFSTLLQDSEGNLLLFEYPEEEGMNMFNVYVFKNGGEFICKSSFVCDDYDLSINPAKMVFHNGYIYGLQKKKNVEEIPLRLVRFTISAGN